jgi:hypothetical protein
MKTTKNMNQIVKVSIASIVLLLALTLTHARAAYGNSGMIKRNEIQAASNRLEALSLKIEKEIKFSVPAVPENTDDLFELKAAGYRLENMAASMEKAAKYVSTTLNEAGEDYEMIGIFASLDQVNNQIEQLIKYTVPSDVE